MPYGSSGGVTKYDLNLELKKQLEAGNTKKPVAAPPPPPPPPPAPAPPPPPAEPTPVPEAAPQQQATFAPPTAPGVGWAAMTGSESLNPRLGMRLPRPSIMALVDTGGY